MGSLAIGSCRRVNIRILTQAKSSVFALLGALGVDAKALETPDHRIGLRVFRWRAVHLRSHRPVFRHIPQDFERWKRQHRKHVRAVGADRNNHVSDGSVSACSPCLSEESSDQEHGPELEYTGGCRGARGS